MRRFQLLQYRFETPRQLSFCDCTERFVNARCEYVLNFSSNVIKLTKNGETWFFKEAKLHRKSIEDCVYESIDLFFDEIVPSPALKAKVLESLQKKQRLNRLIDMGHKNSSGSRFNRYLTVGDTDCLGLPTPSSPDEQSQLRKLVFYLYSEVQNWFLNSGVKAGDLETFSAVRALSTYALAEMLGVGYLIPRCDFVKIRINGKEKYGVLTEEAKGESPLSHPYSQRARRVTPQLLCSLTDLNLLDAISRDNDHRVGNYHVVTDESQNYISILSYDNDSPDSYRLSADVGSANLVGCSGFLDKRGFVNRAHLSERSASALTSIGESQIRARLPYLSKAQIWFLIRRIEKVKKAIARSAEACGDFLLEDSEWSTEHIRKDISGEYGKTYLMSLLHDCYYEGGLHAFDML